MNYTNYYNKLVHSRQLLLREKGNGVYYEKHHILPRCLGGTNDKTNLVLLTPKEHFIAHLLLTKMYEGKAKAKMYFAFWRMCSSKRNSHSSRMYEFAKQMLGKSMSIIQKGSTTWATRRKNGTDIWTDEQKKKVSDNKKGVLLSDATKKKMSEASKGKLKSESHAQNISKAKKGKTLEEIYGIEGAKIQRIKFDELRKRAHLAQTGRPKSEKTKLKISEKTKNQWSNMSEEQKKLRSQRISETCRLKREAKLALTSLI